MTKICVRCQARKALKGFSRCARCREADRVYWRSLRAERRRDGLCPDCGRKRANGRTYCTQHLEYYAEAARAYKQRKAKATKKAAPAAAKKAAPAATAKKKKTAR